MTPSKEAYQSRLPNGETFTVKTIAGVFQPTHTSELFLKAAYQHGVRFGKTLDLGCGCGYVGIGLAKMSLNSPPLYGSDFDPKAERLAAENAAFHGVAFQGRSGSLLEPWTGMKFDCIVDDVSGIAEEVGRLSPWYANGIPCQSGPDGADLTVEVLERAPVFLNPQGVLFFPVISLSNAGRILETARKYYRRIEKAASQPWMLPASMLAYRNELKRLKGERKIDFHEKFGAIFCWTEIYKALV